MQGFHFITTEDGSPSLRLGESEALSEAMHSLRGAFSETVYIYGTAMELCVREGFAPRFLSMGLGLGYVELLATALALKGGIANFGGESFEIVPELRNWFTAWLRCEETVPIDFVRTYDEIERRTCREFGIEIGTLRKSLCSAVDEGRWSIRHALTPSTEFAEKFGCICFDAFSSKSTPEVWSEDFLVAFLLKTTAPACVLSTYACTGALKRSLRTAGFDLQIREGFSSKRDSTFAVRTVSPITVSN